MKTNRIQAAFARKRETEHLRIERSTAVNRYFDHWGKVTSRFQSWTTPQYYENAEITLKKSNEKKLKDIELNKRRDKLQILLNNEKYEYDKELNDELILKKSIIDINKNGVKRGRRLDNIKTDLLEKIDNNLKEMNEERRRLEMEAKLYSRWRRHPECLNNFDNVHHGGNSCTINRGGKCTPFDENAVFESRTDNEAMAKLNWLDKQIEDQMRRDDEAKETEKRNLQLQEETRKYEETLKERQKIRESEIKEFRGIQEYHVNELKIRENELLKLQNDEIFYKHLIDFLQSELIQLNNFENNIKLKLINEISHNVTKIKMIFRQKSDYFCQLLNNDIERLENFKLLLKNDINNYDELNKLRKKYEKQIIEEYNNKNMIELMYESEAKHNLQKWQNLWFKEFQIRQKVLIELFEKHANIFLNKINEIAIQQKQLHEIRDKHLLAIENSNDKLQILINEEEMKSTTENKNLNNLNPIVNCNKTENCGRNSRIYKRNFGFNWIEDVDGNDSNGGDCEKKNFIDFTCKKISDCHLNGGDDFIAPKFGRKKVAWT